MVDWSKDWISSKTVAKQRKYSYNAPLHIRQKFMGVHLSLELRKKYGRRSITVRKGDTVKILRGQFSKKSGKVTDMELKRSKVYVEGAEHIKKDGSKTPYPINPSNLIITNLILDDKKRKEKLSVKENKKESKKNG
ncbi:50S ribosomal protein L24 [archaeon]|jgi:large subunit ribosomal protein L24|nr:50S ribosomal protein L24 [archaeon]MBT4397012.1 50S ribosomal protein L24 [archaeon]MBT4441003.1 50S ribosomal protein L24 [archaeon]